MYLEYNLAQIDDVARELLANTGELQVWAIEGSMGAGKTTLIHALCKQLGVKSGFGSPTFSLINEYKGVSGIIYHIDLYRCKNEEEALRAGVEDCLFSGSRCFVEWPSKAPGLFPTDTLGISLGVLSDDKRKIDIRFPTENQSQYPWRTHSKS